MPGKQVSPSISFSHSDEGDDGGQKVLRVKKAGRQRGRGGWEWACEDRTVDSRQSRDVYTRVFVQATGGAQTSHLLPTGILTSHPWNRYKWLPGFMIHSCCEESFQSNSRISAQSPVYYVTPIVFFILRECFEKKMFYPEKSKPLFITVTLHQYARQRTILHVIRFLKISLVLRSIALTDTKYRVNPSQWITGNVVQNYLMHIFIGIIFSVGIMSLWIIYTLIHMDVTGSRQQ